MKRNIKYWFQRRIRGWSDDETWNLDYEFIKWVNSRFKKYKEIAGKNISLKFRTFTYKRNKCTQLELIDNIINISDELLDEENGFYDLLWEEPAKLENKVNEMIDMFKLVYWAMWW